MDEFYSKQNAAKSLEQIIKDRDSALGADSEANDLYLATTKLANCTTRFFNQPRAWRLCIEKGPDSSLEEACFRVQGVLCGKDLPPVVLNGARKYLRQNVKLTGLGNEDMVRCINQIEAIYLKLSNHFKEGSLEPWQPSMFDGNPALEANARYFTQANHSAAGDIVEFAPYVDASGSLRELMEADYVHTSDNRVDYMEQLIGPDGARMYRAVDPVVFKHGDIVEATVSFAAIPTKNNSAKMHIQLRALLLLDQTERNAAAILRMRRRYQTIDFGATLQQQGQPVLKRRIMYYETGDTDTEEAGRRFNRMRVDSDSE
ncbi:hypothetical protein H1R20_g2861, partial [Candolleomyces eurysporus]